MNYSYLAVTTAVVIAISACSTPNPLPHSETTAVHTEPQSTLPPASPAKPDEVRKSTGEEEKFAELNSAGSVRDQLSRLAQSAMPKVLEKREFEIQEAQARSPDFRQRFFAPIEVGPWQAPVVDRENYAHLNDNPIKRAAETPVSTFSIDVDTSAYSNMRRLLNTGRLPAHDAVRVEEMVNYFGYDYPAQTDKSHPFNVITELGPTPWNPKSNLLQIGVKGYDVPKNQIPAANLTFLIDVSGSMISPDKLELLKTSMKLLVNELRAQDHVAIVVYAGAAGMVLEPTAGDHKARIIAALDRLNAGGSTNGGAGIQLAYSIAQQMFVKGGINRIILASDGDYNVGTVNFEALKNLVEEQRKSGISLTTLGFGSGNYNDQLLEQLADAGNGNAAYIDNLNEGRKVLVEQLSSTLLTIAKDVKIQIELNPDVVSEYRLIGYENRILAREDFNNDQIDAGELGAGHTVTALYEVVLAGSGGEHVDPLRYPAQVQHKSERGNELAFLRLRYKAPDSDISQLIETPIAVTDRKPDLAATSERYRFAAAVAGFGQLLRGGKYTGTFNYGDVLTVARAARGADPFGYRGEFVSLVGLAQTLSIKSARRE